MMQIKAFREKKEEMIHYENYRQNGLIRRIYLNQSQAYVADVLTRERYHLG